MLGYGCANTAFAGLAIQLVLRRESGILKRLRGTPLPASTYIAALLASTLIVFALQAVLLFVLGRVLHSTPFPNAFGSLVLAIVLGSAVFAAIGVAIASIIRSGEGSSAVVNFILLPAAFLTGSFGPTRHYPTFLRAIGDRRRSPFSAPGAWPGCSWPCSSFAGSPERVRFRSLR
jgi:ABC-type multidrug transport system permease subunit